MITTVTGPIPLPPAGVIDAHTHTWIEPLPNVSDNSPALNDPRIAWELADFRSAGGWAVVDCQPPGCGRAGDRMVALSQASGVKIVSVTGFHLRRYYPPNHWLWRAGFETARDFFLRELKQGLAECCAWERPPRAGLVKVACEASLDQSPLLLLEAATAAAIQTGAALAVHTEKGAQAEDIARQLSDWGLPLDQLILFHMDKRPDLALHQELAGQGILLEYDTFFRDKYAPQENLYPLLAQMVAGNFSHRIAIGSDMADSQMWSRLGGGPGLTGWFTHIIPQLERLGFSPQVIRQLTGANIAARLDDEQQA